MRRFATSLPYEDRIGLEVVAGKPNRFDNIRRSLTLPVADTHLDDAARRPAGRLLECDNDGSLLADVKFRAYETADLLIHNIKVNDGPTLLVMPSEFRHLELHRAVSAVVWAAYRIDTNATVLQIIPSNRMVSAPGVVGTYWVYVEGLAGASVNILAYHFK